MSYRTVIYAATFCSGAAGLIFQVVWQRYLSFLVGSEAKSVSLVVAVFLFGLAAGYRFWGNITEKNWSRQKLLKAVGFVELGIAIYGLVFSTLFAQARELAYAGPDSLVFDLLITLGLLFVPTFLMGATIPLLTAAVPAGADEVNYCHSRIYGINTLGAFLGALVGGFYLVPQLGLLMSLIIAAIIDASVGIFFLLNRLSGEMHKAEDVPEIPNAFGSWGIYLFVFVTGATSIGLEVLFIRLVGLSIGSGLYVFPIVVGIVILGLAIGSLSLRRTGMNALRVPRELIKISIILTVLYLTAPYWGYWINHARISLTSIPSNYAVYLAIVLMFFSALLLPLIIPMGRLLPVGYALIRKTRSDYGKMCGYVYFANTLGTVVGAVVIGYVLFLWLDLPEIFKFTIVLLTALAAFLWLRESRARSAVVALGLAVIALLLPGWNRDLHCFSLHRTKTVEDFHFRGLFHIPPRIPPNGLLLLRDDPNATVSLVQVRNKQNESGESMPSKAISVNGKPDGDTLGDYSNMVLTGMLPYLFAHPAKGLDVAIVGFGSGMTTGALAMADDVESVTTLEISSSVIAASPLIGEDNFNVAANPKSRIVQTDAFRFFARSDERFDIIISEPSNPWVVGVENLFTKEFYQLVGQSLNENGVFAQWVQLYAIDREILAAISHNVLVEFENASLFLVGLHDLVIVASHAPLDAPHRERRIQQESIKFALGPMALHDGRVITLLETHPGPALMAMSKGTPTRVHSLEMPWIGHAAARASFMGSQLEAGSVVLRDVGRHLPVEQRRRHDFASFMAHRATDITPWCMPDAKRHSTEFVCKRLQSLAADYLVISAPLEKSILKTRLQSYAKLREQGYIELNLGLLDEMVELIIANRERFSADDLKNAARALASEYAREWRWEVAGAVLQRFQQEGILSPSDVEAVHHELMEYRERVDLWMDVLNS